MGLSENGGETGVKRGTGHNQAIPCPVCGQAVDGYRRVYCCHSHKIKAYRMRRALRSIRLSVDKR